MARRCKQCRKELKPAAQCDDIIEKKGYCGPSCLIAHTKAKQAEKQARAKRREIRQAKERLKTRSDWMKEAQQAFNAYIRARDAGKPCISCGAVASNEGYMSWGNCHAGHYRSIGACPELRFEESNVHNQCAKCNIYKSGNVVEYRINLIKRIGLDQVEWLEQDHDPKKYTIDDLKEIRDKYRAMKRELEKVHN